MKHTFIHNGCAYEFYTEACMDSALIAVNLDPGNGKFETIGYLPADATRNEIRAMVAEEIDTLNS